MSVKKANSKIEILSKENDPISGRFRALGGLKEKNPLASKLNWFVI